MIGLVVLLATTSGVLLSTRSEKKHSASVFERPMPSPQEATPRLAASLPQFRPDLTEAAVRAEKLQEEIAKEVERQDPVIQTEADLARYLGELESAARRKGRVSALEVEPGLRALARLEYGALGEERAMQLRTAFTDKMSGLSRELDPTIATQTAMVVHPITMLKEENQ
jgi:hypothetical protein